MSQLFINEPLDSDCITAAALRLLAKNDCLQSDIERRCESIFFAWEPVGLKEIEARIGWASTDFVDFAGQKSSIVTNKRQNVHRPAGFAANLL